ncbi:MAG: hypothetical protein ONB23_10475 [candidate division KSB1 bacterium]|nr:hypothetical protein [candidate division KSB1 bacterium]
MARVCVADWYRTPGRALWMVALACLLADCVNPFAPRLRESPEGDLIITEQRTPEEALQNFDYAYTFKDSLLYADLLDSAFVFVYYDPNAGPGGRFESWGRDVDLRTTGRLFRAFDVIDLSWGSTTYERIEGETAELAKTFRLNLVSETGDFQLSGIAVFTLRKCPSDGKWRIVRWKDESEF